MAYDTACKYVLHHDRTACCHNLVYRNGCNPVYRVHSKLFNPRKMLNWKSQSVFLGNSFMNWSGVICGSVLSPNHIMGFLLNLTTLPRLCKVEFSHKVVNGSQPISLFSRARAPPLGKSLLLLMWFKFWLNFWRPLVGGHIQQSKQHWFSRYGEGSLSIPYLLTAVVKKVNRLPFKMIHLIHMQ